MSEVSSTIREDLGVVTERLIPFAPRGETREKLWELHEEYKEKVSNMDDLRHNKRMCCPIHGHNEEVTITGAGKTMGRSSCARSGTTRI
ncbi:hypothetical protein AKJ40_05010 [candidate division MSBL1 archaeon SCGC-AAA259M10]|uniref:Uncharacterized protein n=1 Tax=candidate division MSBL1 archaeon SCGC-AAA259M10 TaxID=1698270 RepID=A0A133UUS2_9EURY|nr:hypothetical protein AKJ40_05010 [candidate division MSBL1 archaeon SCGC-AAA259M10]